MVSIVLKGLGKNSSMVLKGFSTGDKLSKSLEWKRIIIRGIDTTTGKYIYIQGEYAEA